MAEAPIKLSTWLLKHFSIMIIIIIIMLITISSLGSKKRIEAIRAKRAMINLDRAMGHLTDIYKFIMAHVRVTCLKFTNGVVNNTYTNLKRCALYRLHAYESWVEEMGTALDELRHFRRALFMIPDENDVKNPHIMDLIEGFIDSHREIIYDAKAVAKFVTKADMEDIGDALPWTTSPDEEGNNATEHKDMANHTQDMNNTKEMKLDGSGKAKKNVQPGPVETTQPNQCTPITMETIIVATKTTTETTNAVTTTIAAETPSPTTKKKKKPRTMARANPAKKPPAEEANQNNDTRKKKRNNFY